MKKNNQGFMLIEALIMSMVIIGVLVFMYIMFQNISNSYDKSFQYNTVTGLYIANEIRDYLYDNNLDDLKLSVESSDSKYQKISCSSSDTTWTEFCSRANIKIVLITDESLSGLKGKRVNDSALSQTMYDFINYLKVDNKSGYRILVEFKDNTYASLNIREDD